MKIVNDDLDGHIRSCHSRGLPRPQPSTAVSSSHRESWRAVPMTLDDAPRLRGFVLWRPEGGAIEIHEE